MWNKQRQQRHTHSCQSRPSLPQTTTTATDFLPHSWRRNVFNPTHGKQRDLRESKIAKETSARLEESELWACSKNLMPTSLASPSFDRQWALVLDQCVFTIYTCTEHYGVTFRRLLHVDRNFCWLFLHFMLVPKRHITFQLTVQFTWGTHINWEILTVPCCIGLHHTLSLCIANHFIA